MIVMKDLASCRILLCSINLHVLFLMQIKLFEIKKENKTEREREKKREQHSPLSPKESRADSMIDGFVKGSLGVP